MPRVKVEDVYPFLGILIISMEVISVFTSTPYQIIRILCFVDVIFTISVNYSEGGHVPAVHDLIRALRYHLRDHFQICFH